MVLININHKINIAVQNRDAAQVGECADILRFKLGLNYDQTYNFFHEITNIDKPTFDDLLSESEEIS